LGRSATAARSAFYAGTSDKALEGQFLAGIVNDPDADGSAKLLIRADGSLSRMQLDDAIVVRLWRSFPSAQPKDAFERVERRLDQVVEVPAVVRALGHRSPERNFDLEAGTRTGLNPARGDRRADRFLPGLLVRRGEGGWSAANLDGRVRRAADWCHTHDRGPAGLYSPASQRTNVWLRRTYVATEESFNPASRSSCSNSRSSANRSSVVQAVFAPMASPSARGEAIFAESPCRNDLARRACGADEEIHGADGLPPCAIRSTLPAARAVCPFAGKQKRRHPPVASQDRCK
jgi:hypothetical protein